jgi:CheY-like chemotaxis protein
MVHVAREGPHLARVVVRDTGEGIPEAALSKLFDPFFQVPRQGKGHAKGLGLGLSIAKQLVELHGGMIAVESREGTGTEFRFTLPVRHALEKRIDGSLGPKQRILVVDDDPDIRQLLQDRLQAEGYLVCTAVDGRSALAALQQQSLDGLILGIGMPDIDGLQVLHQVRDKYPTMPVVMITAVEARERAMLAMQAGAQAYLLKPFDQTQLKHVVDYWFRPDDSRSESCP